MLFCACAFICNDRSGRCTKTIRITKPKQKQRDREKERVAEFMDQTFDQQPEKKDPFIADALCNVHSAVCVCADGQRCVSSELGVCCECPTV